MERTRNFPDTAFKIRMQHRKLRDEMSEKQVKLASECICEKLFLAEWYTNATWIYGYYPLGNEVDCLLFLKKALADGKHIALPRTKQDKSHTQCKMDFYEITSFEQVEAGRFGVLEPTRECHAALETNAVVLVPGVVFDEKGNRYGYGKGYYDRYFARFPNMYKLALAYEHQIEKELLVLEHDVKMNAIYTERQSYLFAERIGEGYGTIGNL